MHEMPNKAKIPFKIPKRQVLQENKCVVEFKATS